MALGPVEMALSWTDLQLLGTVWEKMAGAGITESEFVCGGGPDYPRLQGILSPEEIAALRRLGVIIDALEGKS